MTTQRIGRYEEPDGGSWLPQVDFSALTLTAVIAGVVVLLRPIERSTSRPPETTGHTNTVAHP